jgi:RNA polymerase sigma-70 factor, ECF subfamily
MTTLVLDASTTLEHQSPVPSFPTLDLADAITQAKNWGASVRDTLQESKGARANHTYASLEQATDQELMAAIALGRDAALERLYERYARLAYALAYRLLRDAQAAEDIVQEAFLAVWRKAGTYQAQHGSVSSWLQAIVHHRAIDRLRSASGRDKFCAPLEPGVEQQTIHTVPDACDQVWQGEQRRLVLAALAQIPPEQRQVIDLAYFGGYTHAEIAAMLCIPPGTVKGRLRLGLCKLKALLEKSGIHEE